MTAAFVAAALLGIAVFVSGVRYEWGERDIFDSIGFTLLGFLAAAVVGALAFVAAYFGIAVAANQAFAHEDRYSRVALVALRDETGSQSAYVLGSGGSEASASYVFYFAGADGGRELANVDAAGVRVFEGAGEPYAVRFEGCVLSVPWLSECLNAGWQFTELHVPAGSMSSRFDLDLGESK